MIKIFQTHVSIPIRRERDFRTLDCCDFQELQEVIREGEACGIGCLSQLGSFFVLLFLMFLQGNRELRF